MAIEKINLETGKAQRHMLAMWVEVEQEEGRVAWEPLGIGTEDASLNYEYDEATATDIWNTTETLINSVNKSISFDPYFVRAGDNLQATLIDILNREAWGELSNFKILLVRYYIGKPGKYQAMTYDGCTIKVQSEGGSGYVSMPIDVNFGGSKTLGTVDVMPPSTPVFSAA